VAKATIKELEEKLKNSQRLIELQKDDISRLHKELEDTRNNLGVVSSLEFKSVITELDTNKKLYKLLEQNKDREIELLRKEMDSLKQTSTEIKTERNSRGAGRKEFQDYRTVKNIFKSYTNGESLQSIANKLNESDIKTKAGGKWAKSSVRFILLNHSYVEKEVIDEKTFELITELMKNRNYPK
jgi:phage shock protein A